MHAKLVSIWLACRSVFVKVMAHGVDLPLHATVSIVFVWQLAFILTPPYFHSVVECPTLNDPDNGNLILSGNTIGQTAEYTCNNGFNLGGESLLICGPDGQWTGNPPVCGEGRHLVSQTH